MRCAHAIASGNRIRRHILAPLSLCLAFACAHLGRAQSAPQAFTDRTTYNAGSTVQLKVEFPKASQPVSVSVGIEASITYAGDSKPVVNPILWAAHADPARMTGYQTLWRIPAGARTGRYEVRLTVRDARTHATLSDLPKAASFTVHRKLVKIEDFELDKTFYTSGDPVGCRLSVANISGRALTHLRVEFSIRYWPWIGAPAAAAAASIVTLAPDLTLAPGATRALSSSHAGMAPQVEKPMVREFGVVVWDQGRRKVLDIAFSPLVFVRAPGDHSALPYPGQYIFPDLASINTSAYRYFFAPGEESTAIQFDDSHTMYPEGATATIPFKLHNPGGTPWKGVTLRTRLLGSDGHEIAAGPPSTLDLNPHAAPIQAQASFPLPAGSGLYRVRVEIVAPAGSVLATSDLELAANPLPRSILIFCAHEDDDGDWGWLARAAVENHIPLHFVYFTSGDAGSCDRLYQHSCSPAEALAFGGVRMDETRASLGHLGVAPNDIAFLGLPDGGSGEIWYDTPDAAHPYLAPLLASDHAPYEGLEHPNLPYAHPSVLEEVEKLIRRYQPEVVITAYPPDQSHIDHIVNNYFVVQALQALLKESPAYAKTRLLTDRVYNPQDLPSWPYQYQELKFFVTGTVGALQQEAGWNYVSQGGSQGLTRIRPFDALAREREVREIVDWKEHQGWNNQRPKH